MLIGVLFCIYGVEEGPRPVAPVRDGIKEKADKAEEVAQGGEVKKVNLLLDFFNFKDLSTIFKVFTRKRTDKKRTMLFLCYVLLFFGFGPSFGECILSDPQLKVKIFL